MVGPKPPQLAATPLKRLTQVAHRMCRVGEIHAKDSLYEADREETSVVEAKHAPAGPRLSRTSGRPPFGNDGRLFEDVSEYAYWPREAGSTPA
jgi:hypothetical protein